MSLTERSRGELHKAMLEYLKLNGYAAAGSALEQQLQTEGTRNDYKDCTLSRRWACVTRLSEVNDQLEQKVRRMEQELLTLQDPSKVRAKQHDKLPTVPAMHTCLGHRDTITSVAFHPFDSLCYSASEDGSIRVWDFESGEYVRTLRGHTSAVTKLSVNEEGTFLASASTDSTVRVFQLASGDCVRTLRGHEDTVSTVAWLGGAQGILLSGGRDLTIRVWAAESSGQLLQNVRVDEWVRVLSVERRKTTGGDKNRESSMSGSSSTLEVFASAGSDEGYAPMIRLWSYQNPMVCLRSFSAHENVIEDLCFSSILFERTVASIYGSDELKRLLGLPASGATSHSGASPLTRDPSMRLAASASLTVTASMQHSGGSGSIPQHSLYLVTASRDRNIALFDTSNGAQVCTFAHHDNWVRGIGLSPNGKCIVSCSDDGTVKVYDLEKQRVMRTIDAHDHFVTCQALHPEWKPFFLTGSADRSIRVWPCA